MRSVTALGDGRLASASYDNTVRVWDASSGVCLRVLEGHTGRVLNVTALGDGKLASASDDNTVRVWDASVEGPGACLRVLSDMAEESGQLLVYEGGREVKVINPGTPPVSLTNKACGRRKYRKTKKARRNRRRRQSRRN